jgi:hypothetical protein
MKHSPLPDAMKPDIHCVRAHWIRGFMAFRLVRLVRLIWGFMAFRTVRLVRGSMAFRMVNGRRDAMSCGYRRRPSRESTATAGVLHRERGDREEINLELLAWLGL